MATINHEITSLNVRDFLSNDKYVIPIYQRNYDWGEKEVLQLVEDVADYAKEDSNSKYYIEPSCRICACIGIYRNGSF